MDMFTAFKNGALALARDGMNYGELHANYGISEAQWSVLTQKDFWSVENRREVVGVFANCFEVSLTIAGLPSQQIPGQMAAAFIATFVSPANWQVASSVVQSCYDANRATGFSGEHEIVTMSKEQLFSLTLQYAGGSTQQLGYSGDAPTDKVSKAAK